MAKMLNKKVHDQVIDSYPWRDAGGMRRLVRCFSSETRRYRQNGRGRSHHDGQRGRHSPSSRRYSHGIRPSCCSEGRQEHFKRAPVSLLETYETVYSIVCNNVATQRATYSLYSYLFF